MAGGSFRTPTCTAAGSGYSRYIQVVWSSSNDPANNKSTISWTAYGRSNDSSTTLWVTTAPITVKINGTAVLSITSRFPLKKDQKLGSGSVSVSHNSDGTKSVNVSIEAAIYAGTINNTYSGWVSMTNNPVYTLAVSAGTGVSITVNRTFCGGYGSTGNLSAGSKKLCKGDKLKITFTAGANHSITTRTVNGSSFSSGSTHTVSANVSVVSAAAPLKSTVGATDANIGSTSAITIRRYNPSYTHTLTYSFGSLSGTIAAKTSSTTIAWSVPTSFYMETANSKIGFCTITCTTYNGNTSLGSSNCTLTVTASASLCTPSVSGTVVDTNAVTSALTGNSSTLIRYRSTAQCTISAAAKNLATISSRLINNIEPTNNIRTFSNVSVSSFTFKATDSRGYSASKTITPTMIAYIPLTINPIITRPAPTGSDIIMTFSGNYYKGSFGRYSNTLTIRYRYRESASGTYSAWITAPQTSYVIGTSSYYTGSAISLGDEFDYQKSYIFQVQAYDGAENYILSTVTRTITVKKGIPVFDWGENDFNFNVPVMLNGTNILNIIYPKGSVYMHSSSTMPSAVADIGNWFSISGINNLYAWIRTG